MIPAPTIAVDLAGFNEALKEYFRLGTKSREEILLKQGGNLALFLRRRLAALQPEKGRVTREQIARFHAGKGIRVRESARRFVMEKWHVSTNIKTGRQIGTRSFKRRTDVLFGSGLWAAMVARELAIRESARGFTGVSARYPRTLKRRELAKSRFGPSLSAAALNAQADALTIEWDPSRNKLQSNAAASLGKSRARGAIALALREGRADMLQYVRRKLEQNARQAGFA